MSFGKLASLVTVASGRPAVFIACCVLFLLWGAVGPFVGYSDGWQLLMNSATSIVTTALLFLLTGQQTRDTQALQIKLDELIRVTADARNHLIGIDQDADVDLDKLRSGDSP